MKARSSTQINWKAYSLALLCIVTAVAFSLVSTTMARYTTSGDVPADGRVAAWSINVHGAIPQENGIVKFDTANRTREYTVMVTNNSQVAAMPQASVVIDRRYGDININATIAPAAAWDGQPLAPGASAAFTLTMFATNATTDGFIAARVVVDSVQVN